MTRGFAGNDKCSDEESGHMIDRRLQRRREREKQTAKLAESGEAKEVEPAVEVQSTAETVRARDDVERLGLAIDWRTTSSSRVSALGEASLDRSMGFGEDLSNPSFAWVRTSAYPPTIPRLGQRPLGVSQ